MRFLQRNVRETVAQHVKTSLTSLGWVDEPVNFGAEPVVFREVDRQAVEGIVPTTVSIWVPDEGPDRLAELGGPLYKATIGVVMDVYASKQSIAVAVASDIKALFRDRTIPLYDFSVSTPVQGGVIELDSAYIDRPNVRANAIEFAGVWRVVRAFTTVYFEDVGIQVGEGEGEGEGGTTTNYQSTYSDTYTVEVEQV
jgi:hypothetical protein